MSACTCSHDHAHGHYARPAPVDGQVAWSGAVACADTAQLMTLLMHAPAHVAATRAEPGCLHFELAQTDDPLVWRIQGLFRDAAALEAHRKRSAASPWAAATKGFARDIHEVAQS